MPDWRRVGLGLIVLAVVMAAGTLGYLAFGFGALDALYQTVTTVTTVGFGEVRPLSDGARVFTMILILLGVGAALYTLSALIETLVGGELEGTFGRRRMQRQIGRMKGHVILCGWGRVGRTISRELATADEPHVVVERDATKLEGVTCPNIVGDATDDAVLREAGLDRARALVAALDNDAGNLFVTMSVRTLRPDLFIVSRVRIEENEEKMRRAGADRVINPQSIGGSRAAAFLLQPHVSEFLDVVMHDRDIEFASRSSTSRRGPCSPVRRSETHTSVTRPARSCSRSGSREVRSSRTRHPISRSMRVRSSSRSGRRTSWRPSRVW
jgi:voltage-gated potassium channel